MPNFELMKKPIRFGAAEDNEQEAGDAPAPFMDRAEQARRFAQLREASAVVEILPGPGETLHAIMTGRYDLADTIIAIIRKVGRCRNLKIATLGYHARNIEAIDVWMRSKLVGSCQILTSLFHRDHNRELFADTQAIFAEYPGSKVAAARAHCKVVLMDFGKTKYVIEGSANLRTNSNWEQFQMCQSEPLYEWHAAWIGQEIEKYEVKEAAAAMRKVRSDGTGNRQQVLY